MAQKSSTGLKRLGSNEPRLHNWLGYRRTLRGNLAGHYRLRTGDYRLQFRVVQSRKAVRVERVNKGKKVVDVKEVVETRVIVVKAGHRDGFYEK